MTCNIGYASDSRMAAVQFCFTHQCEAPGGLCKHTGTEVLRTILTICDGDWPESKGPHVTIDAIRHHARKALGIDK